MFNQSVAVMIMVSSWLMISTSWADDSSYWQCASIDSEGKQWVIKQTYQRSAINLALQACKQDSRIPLSCQVSHEACEEFENGVSTRPAWTCTALDDDGKPWISNPYPKKDDAILAAQAYCQEHSTTPDNCYVNELTCKNTNERS